MGKKITPKMSMEVTCEMLIGRERISPIMGKGQVKTNYILYW